MTLLDKVREVLGVEKAVGADREVLEAFLAAHVAELTESGKALATPPFAYVEVFEFIKDVSVAVRDGLAVVDVDKKLVVKTIVRYVLKTYVVTRFGFLSFLLTDAVLDGVIEFIYQAVVKVKKPAPVITAAEEATPVVDPLTGKVVE